MSLGIIEAIHDGYVTFDQFPGLSPALRHRFQIILENLKKWSTSRNSLENSLLLYVSADEAKSMLTEWNNIFSRIIKEEFTPDYCWIEAKEKYWNEYKKQNLRVFWNHKYYNMVLDGLEKVYQRHLPRKTEHTPTIVRTLEILRLAPLVEEHYTSHKDLLAPWESQD